VIESVKTAQSEALPGLEAIRQAGTLVYAVMPATPQYSWPLLNQRTRAEVWVKHENHTPVGAFKIRGGLIYMDWLKRTQSQIHTVISATRGNHGQSVAFAASRFGLRAVLVVPRGNSREKNLAMRALGAELIEFGDDFQAASEHAMKLAAENGWHRIPTYDRRLVEGVATYALEFLTACPWLDTVYVPIGMGSGISAMIAVRDGLGLTTKIVGVLSAHAQATALSLAAGRVVEAPATTAIADGVACRRPDEVALAVMEAGMERIVSVTDTEVEQAMRVCFADTHQVAEGGGAVGLAALLQDRQQGRTALGSRLGVVLSGGNVDSEVFARILGSGGAD